ncbi:MAG: hypothetical protein QXH21_08200 [Ignisphaera sp.]
MLISRSRSQRDHQRSTDIIGADDVDALLFYKEIVYPDYDPSHTVLSVIRSTVYPLQTLAVSRNLRNPIHIYYNASESNNPLLRNAIVFDVCRQRWDPSSELLARIAIDRRTLEVIHLEVFDTSIMSSNIIRRLIRRAAETSYGAALAAIEFFSRDQYCMNNVRCSSHVDHLSSFLSRSTWFPAPDTDAYRFTITLASTQFMSTVATDPRYVEYMSTLYRDMVNAAEDDIRERGYKSFSKLLYELGFMSTVNVNGMEIWTNVELSAPFGQILINPGCGCLVADIKHLNHSLGITVLAGFSVGRCISVDNTIEVIRNWYKYIEQVVNHMIRRTESSTKVRTRTANLIVSYLKEFLNMLDKHKQEIEAKRICIID